MTEHFIEVDTGGLAGIQNGDDLFQNRAAVVDFLAQEASAEVTIIIQAYNRLEKTRRCVESVLKYTGGIDYELLLIDNGSTDGTLAYFQSVPVEKKTILHVTKNLGTLYPHLLLNPAKFGRYICTLNNDIIVTQNWLSNLLLCIKSDPRIGMVNPVSSNASNYQQVGLPFETFDEMQEQAARFNRSDPRKWEDRLRLITLGTLYRKEVVLALGWPLGDAGFFHDFSDDDITFAVRRHGYRTVLAGDTWVCHDHDIYNMEGKDPEAYEASLEAGRKNFLEKHGVDAWDDVDNHLLNLAHFPPPAPVACYTVLGVDVKCGSPMLDVKNWLRRQGAERVELSAFVQQPEYRVDLKTICQGPVMCDREEFLRDCFEPGSFDYVLLDRPMNQYHEPYKLLRDAFDLCREGGVVSCRLANTYNFRTYLNLLGEREVFNREPAYDMPGRAFRQILFHWGEVYNTARLPFDLSPEDRAALEGVIPPDLPPETREEILKGLITREYLYIVRKGAGERSQT